MDLIAATEFSMQELADAYNETRIDYIIPMPMTVERLRAYVERYDVDLSGSCAAVRDGEILGIGMLGVREGRAWVTRLGVLPSGRRQGVGRGIMGFLMEAAEERNLPVIWLEVIEGNNPAHALFNSLGFSETRELIVARRPPTFREIGPGERVHRPRTLNVRTMGYEGTMALLEERSDNPNWLNQTESLQNVAELSSLRVETEGGGLGWVTYKTSLLQLTRLVVNVSRGEPAAVATAILETLHEFYPTQDAIAENIPHNDPVWQGFLAVGYFEAFRRIEMVKEL